MNDRRPIPYVTLAVGAWALAAGLFPALASSMELTRQGLAQGELWRLLTAHLAHWGGSHLFWDLATFAVLSGLYEMNIFVPHSDGYRASRSLLLALGLCTSALMISLVTLCMAEIHAYRGLSGLCVTAFVMLMADLIVSACRSSDFSTLVGVAFALIGLAFKVYFEASTANTVFASLGALNCRPLWEAHVIGGLSGALAVLAPPGSTLRYNFQNIHPLGTQRNAGVRTPSQQRCSKHSTANPASSAAGRLHDNLAPPREVFEL